MRTTYPSDPRWPCLRWDKDRHGNLRCYYRDVEKPGSKQTRLRAQFGTEAFDAEYRTARALVATGVTPKKRVEKWTPEKPDPVRVGQNDAGSLNYLLATYYQSTEWLDELSPRSREIRRPLLDKMAARLVDGMPLGKRRFIRMEKGHVMDLRDDLRATPGQANNLIHSLSGVFRYALERKMVDANPCKGVKLLPPKKAGGWRQVTVDELKTFFDHYEPGTLEHTAMTVLLYTGARRSDAHRFNDDMVLDGINAAGKRCRLLSYEVTKGKYYNQRKNKPVNIVTVPILPPLQAVLDTRPKGQKDWIVGVLGKAFTCPTTLTHYVRGWTRDIGLPDFTPHGVRKAAAALALENGADIPDLMAIFGWETARMALLYGRNFQRSKRAIASMHTIALPQGPSRKLRRVA